MPRRAAIAVPAACSRVAVSRWVAAPSLTLLRAIPPCRVHTRRATRHYNTFQQLALALTRTKLLTVCKNNQKSRQTLGILTVDILHIIWHNIRGRGYAKMAEVEGMPKWQRARATAKKFQHICQNGRGRGYAKMAEGYAKMAEGYAKMAEVTPFI